MPSAASCGAAVGLSLSDNVLCAHTADTSWCVWSTSLMASLGAVCYQAAITIMLCCVGCDGRRLSQLQHDIARLVSGRSDLIDLPSYGVKDPVGSLKECFAASSLSFAPAAGTGPSVPKLCTTNPKIIGTAEHSVPQCGQQCPLPYA